MSPLVGGYAPPFLLFLLHFPDSSRVACCPSESVSLSFPQTTVTSPLRAITSTVPFTSVTSNSVHTLEAGVTETSSTCAAIAFEVATLTLPCSRDTALSPKVMSESDWMITLEPEAVIVATDSGLVCTKSPGKIAEERGKALPLSHTVPLPSSMAAPVSAALRDTGMQAIIIQQTSL